MTCVPAPACKALLAEASRLWPARKKYSDGICPSPEHTAASPTSDHELGNAVDLTDDPANGCAAHVLAEQIRQRRDPRVKLIISNRRIASFKPVAGHPAWAWRPYSGPNPHEKHAHFSIHAGARNDTSPWFLPTATEAPTAPPTDYPEDKMRSHSKRIPLGADGTGWIEVAIPATKLCSITVNGMNIEGRTDTGRAIVCDHLAWAAGSRIVARASKPGTGQIDVTVWEVTG